MAKKITVFTVAIALFVMYLSYEYYRISSYNDSTIRQDSQRYHFDLSNKHSSNREENSINIMDSTLLTQFKLDIIKTLSDVVDEKAAVMPFMPNSTAREELGQATWRLLHTMATRFPRNPSPSEQAAFELFVVLLSKLYPCGNCASHFQALLSNKPPNFPSRDAAIQWMCEAHNIVNARLQKKIFDCSKAGEAWKCGCPESEEFFKSETSLSTKNLKVSLTKRNNTTTQ